MVYMTRWHRTISPRWRVYLFAFAQLGVASVCTTCPWWRGRGGGFRCPPWCQTPPPPLLFGRGMPATRSADLCSAWPPLLAGGLLFFFARPDCPWFGVTVGGGVVIGFHVGGNPPPPPAPRWAGERPPAHAADLCATFRLFLLWSAFFPPDIFPLVGLPFVAFTQFGVASVCTSCPWRRGGVVLCPPFPPP